MDQRGEMLQFSISYTQLDHFTSGEISSKYCELCPLGSSEPIEPPRICYCSRLVVCQVHGACNIP